jgi:hypothetical protein
VDVSVLRRKCPGPGYSCRIGCVQSGHAMLVRPPRNDAILDYHAVLVPREGMEASALTQSRVRERHRDKLSQHRR